MALIYRRFLAPLGAIASSYLTCLIFYLGLKRVEHYGVFSLFRYLNLFSLTFKRMIKGLCKINK